MNTSTENTSIENKEDILGFMKDHIRRYEETNGEDGHIMNGCQCLVLTTKGKKSGEPRQAAVIYGEYGEHHVITASKGGSETPPAWFFNLQANPESRIQVKDKKLKVRARVAEGKEREKLWEMMVKIFPTYLDYQKKTTRQIAVVVLENI